MSAGPADTVVGRRVVRLRRRRRDGRREGWHEGRGEGRREGRHDRIFRQLADDWLLEFYSLPPGLLPLVCP